MGARDHGELTKSHNLLQRHRMDVALAFLQSLLYLVTSLFIILMTSGWSDAAWLTGWGKRVKLTTDQLDIDADLTNFPILLYISASSGRNGNDISFVFDELTSDDNRKKIAVTTSDGTTQCYVEIEKWDDANEKAWLWVKAPSISGTVDTDLYLYYDHTHADNTDHVGDPESVAAVAVWDGNFKAVYHMQDYDTSNIHDTTSNNNDMAKTAAAEPAATTSGEIGNAQNYDGVNDYTHLTTSNFQFRPALEFWIKTTDTEAEPLEYSNYKDYYGWNFYFGYPSIKGKFMYATSDGGTIASITTTKTLNDGVFHHVVVTDDGANLRLYVDGALDVTAATGTPIWSDSRFYTGVERPEYSIGVPFAGILDEIRISNAVRSDAWIKATYETERDHLLVWGSEEGQHSTYTTMVGNASGWVWATIYSTDTVNKVRSGGPTDWTWQTWTPGSGRKVPQGTAAAWTWSSE